MKIKLLLATVAGLVLVGCSGIGESEAPKPDPSRFLPKSGAAQGPGSTPAANQ